MAEKTFKLTTRKKRGDAATLKPTVHFITKARAQDDSREFPFSNDDYSTLADLIQSRTGIVMKDHKKNMVYGRLVRRLRHLNIASFSDYLHYLAGSGGEVEISNLINAMTTNLTKFFREPHHFDHLAQCVLPDAIKAMEEGYQNRLRIWSAGCSSGEEAYSVAMVLDHALRQGGRRTFDAKVLATDLDSNMLARGRKGDYPVAVRAQIPRQYSSYLHPSLSKDDHYHISNDLRAYISFKYLNLISDWPLKGPIDVIFCRNVLIYFDQETKKRITDKFIKILKPGGWLYLGHSENFFEEDGRLQHVGRTIYRRVR